MTIKEIAKLAGVSISTVSKVINNKDEGIRPETRQRILQIVKEYHYTPYGDVLSAQKGRSFMLGLVYDSDGGYERTIARLSKEAVNYHYNMIVTVGKTQEEEEHSFSMLASQNVDGILWYPIKNSTFDSKAYENKYGIPVVSIDLRGHNDTNNICYDYENIAYQMTQSMIEKGHEKILCLGYWMDRNQERFELGYRKCMSDHNLAVGEGSVYRWSSDETELDVNLFSYTAVVCYDILLARRLADVAKKSDIFIPEDLSLAATSEWSLWIEGEMISLLVRPAHILSEFAVKKLVDRIDGVVDESVLKIDYKYNHQRSIAVPKTIRNRCLMTVSPIAIETTIKLKPVSDDRDVNYASNQKSAVSGAGYRHLTTAKKLGVICYPVWTGGNDIDGRKIYGMLKKENVNVEGVTLNGEAVTPRIYTICKGEKKEQIFSDYEAPWFPEGFFEERKNLIKRCHYCLLHGFTDMSGLEPLLRLTRKYSVKTVLKLHSMRELKHVPAGAADVLVVPIGIGDESLTRYEERLAELGTELFIGLNGDRYCRYYQKTWHQTLTRRQMEMSDNWIDELMAALACFLPRRLGHPEQIDEAIERSLEEISNH